MNFPPPGAKPYWARLHDWMLVAHNEDGTIKTDALDTAGLATDDDIGALQSDIAQTNADLLTVEATANRVDSQRFDIRAYGASTALTDNIAAINLATAAANAQGGGEVFVPDGLWLVRPSPSSWIKLYSDVTFRLAPGATIKVGDDTGNYSTIFGATTLSTYVEHVTITGGTIDHNVAGNTTSTVAVGSINTFCASVVFYNFDGVTVDTVRLNGVGVNTIALNGEDCRNALVIECPITWARGASAAAYDNSAIYLNVREGGHIIGNTGNATVSPTSPAMGFCEAHGNNLNVNGNIVDGFQTLCNIVTESNVSDTRATNGIKVIGNIHTNANNSISLWSITGFTLRGVQVTNNFISIAQVDHNQRTAWGILFYRSVSLNGDYDGADISHNTIRFQTGDTRTTNHAGVALDTASICGIGLNPFGNISNVNLDHNTVYDSPTFGMIVGISSDVTYTNTRIHGRSNKFVNCGRNTSLSTSLRAGVVFLGQLVKVDFDDTLFVDDGNPSTNGANSILASTGLTSGVQSTIRNTRYQVTSSTALTHTINRAKLSDLYNTATLNFPSVAAGGIQTLPITVTGARVGDVVAISTLSAVTAGIVFMPPIVTATDTVTIVAMNPTAAPIDPAAVIVQVQVLGGQVR
jgi:hypothetical protein